SVYEHALPQLEARGTKATFFITAGWTDTRAGFLRRAQLAELARLGHSIQSHGWSHAFLPSCGPAQLRQELVQPKQLLEDHLGQAVTEISMPFGRWNRRVLAACRDAGYQRVFTSDAGAAPRHLAGIEVLGRYMARRRTTAAGIAALLASDPGALRRQWLRRLASRSLQALLGTPFYHRLWLRWSSAPPEAAAELGEPHPR
ncbi:MAG: polysaccharide deacetylase family protein, partial [Terriglobales bacterium]